MFENDLDVGKHALIECISSFDQLYENVAYILLFVPVVEILKTSRN